MRDDGMTEFLVGIDVGGTRIKMMVMDAKLREIGCSSIPTNYELGYETVSDNILAALEELFAQNGIKNKKVLSVAMGLPGIVNFKSQEPVYLAVLEWDGFNPCKKIGDFFDAPYVIDNDANLNTMGEYYFGVQKKYRNMVLITLGTGVGCGVIVDGKSLRGSDNLAAELGHMTIVADGGEVCLCGQTGHLEAYCSGTAMAGHAQKMMELDPDTSLHKYVAENGGIFQNEMVDRGISDGDKTCMLIMNRFSHYLSVGCSNVMKLFNPEIIFLGGGISNAGKFLLDPVNEEAGKNVMHPYQRCPIKKATLGSKAGMYGACALAANYVTPAFPGAFGA
jgi:glucokinase